MLVGADLGGWIAAEMMVRSTARFSCLVLVAPLGIKLRGRDERDIADMHAHDAGRIPAGSPGPTRRRARSTTPRCRTTSWRRSCAAARPSRCTAGSPTCTTRGSSAGCTASTGRPCCCGARRTASSPLPTARAGGRKFPAPGSMSIPAAGHFPALGTAGSIRPAPVGVRRRPQRIAGRNRCASGISPRWPITRPGKRG